MLNEIDKKLIKTAKDLIKKRRSKKTKVACTLISTKGNIYSGVNIHTECAPCSICAEYAAIASMITAGDKNIKTIVTVDFKGKIIPPCGQCQEFMYDVTHNNDIEMIVSIEYKIRLKDIFKYHWQDSW